MKRKEMLVRIRTVYTVLRLRFQITWYRVLVSRMQPKKNSKEDKKDFKWTDDEVELLLNVSNEYKVSKASESVDWESVKSKYSDIYDLFVAALPNDDWYHEKLSSQEGGSH